MSHLGSVTRAALLRVAGMTNRAAPFFFTPSVLCPLSRRNIRIRHCLPRTAPHCFSSVSVAPFPSNQPRTNHRMISSNNPFALVTDDHKLHKGPPAPPSSKAREPPLTPPAPPTSKARERLLTPPTSKAREPPLGPPPSYDEIVGQLKSKEYPPQKSSLKSASHRSRPHHSHYDTTRHHNKERSEKSDREGRSDKHRKRDEAQERKSGKKSSKKSENHKLDVIDKLDVTPLYGGRFHHDGPFDACTPARNRNIKAAPVMAFPADGPNNSMKVHSTVQDQAQLNYAFGKYEDDYSIGGTAVLRTNYSKQPLSDPQLSEIPRLNPSVVAFDVNQKAVPVHGPSTVGLGSTTFVDGAPASKKEEEVLQSFQALGGVGRKKSLAHRLRKNSATGGVAVRKSAEVGRSFLSDEESGSSLLRRVNSLKVSRK